VPVHARACASHVHTCASLLHIRSSTYACAFGIFCPPLVIFSSDGTHLPLVPDGKVICIGRQRVACIVGALEDEMVRSISGFWVSVRVSRMASLIERGSRNS